MQQTSQYIYDKQISNRLRVLKRRYYAIIDYIYFHRKYIYDSNAIIM